MNDIERECIILNSAWDMIDGMVNWAIFVKTDATEIHSLRFKESPHSDLFIILLGDFLSEIRAFKKETVPFGLSPAPSNTSASNLTFLFHLRKVCASSKLLQDASSLLAQVDAFGDWLETEITSPNTYFSDINLSADIRISRFRYLKMCGDIAKHNLARLGTNVRHLSDLLEKSGNPVDQQRAYQAIPNFFEWFKTTVFPCHCTQIAEFLNGIRWAIFDCLRSEFRRAWRMLDVDPIGLQRYTYDLPVGVDDPLAIAMYWSLMNKVRSPPYVQRFTVPENFKQWY